MILPTEITSGTLPLNYTDSPANYFKAFVRRLRGVVPDDQVITGRNDSTDPIVNIGPWLKKETPWTGPAPAPLEWYIWENGSYHPINLFVGNPKWQVEVGTEELTASHIQTLPNKSGTVALLYDIYVPRPTVILASAPVVAVNWAIADNFICRLTQDTLFAMAGFDDDFSTPGGIKKGPITLVVQNNGTAFEANFAASTRWPNGGAEPATPAGSAGKNAVGIFKFDFVVNTMYGELAASSTASPGTVIDTDPTETAGPTYGHPPAGEGGGPGIPTHHII